MRVAALLALLAISVHATPLHQLARRGIAHSVAQLSDSNSPDDGSDTPSEVAQDTLTGSVGSLVWDRLSNFDLLSAAQTSKGAASASPRTAHIKALLAARCPMSVKASLFPTNFLDLSPSNAGVLTITLAPSLWHGQFGTPRPLFARQGLSKTDDWAPCLQSLAEAFADPRNDPLKDITTLRLLGDSRTVDPSLGAGIRSLIQARAEQRNPLRIQADDAFFAALTPIPAGLISSLTVIPTARYRAEWADFFAAHMPTLKELSWLQKPGFLTPRFNEVLFSSRSGAGLSSSLQSSSLEFFTLPGMIWEPHSRDMEFPPKLAKLVLGLDLGESPTFARACTPSLLSLTCYIEGTPEQFAALVACLQRSRNLQEILVFNAVGPGFNVLDPPSSPVYAQYLRLLAESPTISRIAMPLLSTQRVGHSFPRVTHLTGRLSELTDNTLSPFPGLTHLSVTMNTLNPPETDKLSSIWKFEARGITHLTFTFDGGITDAELMCGLADRTDAFVSVEHLRMTQEGTWGSWHELWRAVRCFVSANRLSLRTVNGIPLAELRAKFQRFDSHFQMPSGQSVAELRAKLRRFEPLYRFPLRH